MTSSCHDDSSVVRGLLISVTGDRVTVRLFFKIISFYISPVVNRSSKLVYMEKKGTSRNNSTSFSIRFCWSRVDLITRGAHGVSKTPRVPTFVESRCVRGLGVEGLTGQRISTERNSLIELHTQGKVFREKGGFFVGDETCVTYVVGGSRVWGPRSRPGGLVVVPALFWSWSGRLIFREPFSRPNVRNESCFICL